MIFDFERAHKLLNICEKIFSGEEFDDVVVKVTCVEKEGKFYLRFDFKDIQFDFKCYRYC